MQYCELTVVVPAAHVEVASAVLREVADSGVSIETAFTQATLESGAVPLVNGTATLRAYVRAGGCPSVEADVERALVAAGTPATVSQRLVAEEDWAESWKEHWHVERFGERIVVVPSWRQYEPQPRDVVLHLDPGMAFGTGQHETTRMCLEALERAVIPGMRVLDAGCGSGILAICAARLGAREVLAVDIDPDAVAITRDNARRNGVEAAVHVGRGSLRTDTDPDGRWPFPAPPMGFDIVVANIIAGALIDLAAPLLAALSADGLLIVSGVIAGRAEEVIEAFVRAGARLCESRASGDWRCIELRRA